MNDSDANLFLQLEQQSSSMRQNNMNMNCANSNQATSPPVMRCATDMSALIGSPVGVLDLSTVNQFSINNNANAKQQLMTGPSEK